MIQIILLIITICMALYGILLIRSFEYMSVRELKRQARAGNLDAIKVYPVRAYGVQLWIFMWAFLGLLTSCIILILDNLLGPLWTILINVPLIIVIHAILPWTRRPKPNLHMASVASPVIEKLLRFSFPILKHLERVIGRWIQPEPMLLIQSKEELLEILHHNALEFEHVSRDELKIAENALLFGDKLVGDYMTPLNAVRFVDNQEQLTPIVIDELYSSGHSRFPVMAGDNQNIIGTLLLKDIVKVQNSNFVKDVIRPEVYYINEQQTLDHSLHAFIKTKHHLFMVVNEFEDIVGIITVEDVIEQIVGKPIMDEFDNYDDMREVAKLVAIQKHKNHKPEHV
jgi:CBS domain containing-hemolysin-like protein